MITVLQNFIIRLSLFKYTILLFSVKTETLGLKLSSIEFMEPINYVAVTTRQHLENTFLHLSISPCSSIA